MATLIAVLNKILKSNFHSAIRLLASEFKPYLSYLLNNLKNINEATIFKFDTFLQHFDFRFL